MSKEDSKTKKTKKPTAAQEQQLAQALQALEDAVDLIRDSGLSTRELSLAITNAEQANMWLQYAANELDIELVTDEDDEDDESDEGADAEDTEDDS